MMSGELCTHLPEACHLDSRLTGGLTAIEALERAGGNDPNTTLERAMKSGRASATGASITDVSAANAASGEAASTRPAAALPTCWSRARRESRDSAGVLIDAREDAQAAARGTTEALV